jgi:predicted Zn-dependent peptidase
VRNILIMRYNVHLNEPKELNMETVEMTIHLEAGLYGRFTEVATKHHRQAEQVIQELVRDFIEKAKPHISEEERERRREAVDFARASVELEGFKITPEENAHDLRFIDGEISLDEYLEHKQTA